jgi:hypothetical protein
MARTSSCRRVIRVVMASSSLAMDDPSLKVQPQPVRHPLHITNQRIGRAPASPIFNHRIKERRGPQPEVVYALVGLVRRLQLTHALRGIGIEVVRFHGSDRPLAHKSDYPH